MMDSETRPQKVLFVCIENSNRSQMAEAFARRHGSGVIEPYSAGSRPSGKVNPKAIESMREAGYDLSGHRSKSLAEVPEVEYDFVITMGCGDACPLVRARRREDWNIPDPKSLPPPEFAAVRNLIEVRVKALIERAKARRMKLGTG
jgi:arsenate reductase